MTSGPLPLEAHLAALASLDEVGPARLRALLRNGSPREVWERLCSGRIQAVGGERLLGADRLVALGTQARRTDVAALWDRCRRSGVGVTSLGSSSYPRRLESDLDPPVVLFHRGDPAAVDGPLAAIVGTRRATSYGRRVAEELGAGLSRRGIGVVSGLALGVDASAHRGAVEVEGCRPVAVVGAGLDVACPVRNRDLAESVVGHGVVFSEVPVGVQGAPWRFPVRNRIIAALADVVVVVESAGTGGSMHTVREALDRDRTVMAVPGPIDSRASEGTNQLLADGALVCTGVDDVTSTLGLFASTVSTACGGTDHPEGRSGPDWPEGAAGQVLLELDWRPMALDELADGTGLSLDDLIRAVSDLERDGWIRRSGPMIERDRRREGPPRHAP